MVSCGQAEKSTNYMQVGQQKHKGAVCYHNALDDWETPVMPLMVSPKSVHPDQVWLPYIHGPLGPNMVAIDSPPNHR